MPGWHEATKTARKNGDLVLIGVIQEQHAQRCQLFAQWKQFDWPIVQDPINRLSLAGVPLIVEVDEQGVTKSVNPKVDAVLASLPKKTKANPSSSDSLKEPSFKELRVIAERAQTYASWRELEHFHFFRAT